MSQGFLKMSLDYHGARYKFTSSCNYRSLKVRQSCKEEVHSQLNKIAVFLIYVLFLIVLAFFSHLSRPKKFSRVESGVMLHIYAYCIGPTPIAKQLNHI